MTMLRLSWIPLALALVTADLVRAEPPPRRTSRVDSGPARPAPAAAPAETARTESRTRKPAVTLPAQKRPGDRPDLLEPSHLLEGVGRGAVASFQVDAPAAAIWQLVVREVDGPVAQIFEGEGPPPGIIPWDGRLLDGGLAWSGTRYTYEVAWVDSTGASDGVAGSPFLLPDYSRVDREGLSVLMTGERIVPGGHGDAAAMARSALRATAGRLNETAVLSPVRVEVLAPDERTALALGKTVRAALAELLEPADRPVDLYVGTAVAAPTAGTVLITTVPLTGPAS
jgi:hypothetical protein